MAWFTLEFKNRLIDFFQGKMDNLNILDLDFFVLSQIETILENKSTRESFLKVVPSDIFNYTSIQMMDNEAYKYHMTTARWLLWHLGTKGVTTSEFCYWLEKANIQKALIFLKKDVPIEIIEQPPSVMHVKKGERLLISFKASSFPLPEFQWFKGNEELLLQQDSDLLIPSVKNEDAGAYCCLITKLNIETNDYSWAYTNPVEVVVLEGSFHNPLNTGVSDSSFELDSNKTSFEDDIISQVDCIQQKNLPEYGKKSAKITIRKQPFCNGKIPQGMSVCLHCKAECLSSNGEKIPVKYQWFKNGRIVKGATSSKLLLSDLYPDLKSGDFKWDYFCKVFNDYDKEISKTTTVELASANCTTPYYASGKYALMIANDAYENLQELQKPSYDVSAIGKKLEAMEFKIFAYKNLSLTEMKNAFSRFCEILKENCYILFYFAGHGFEHGQMYLQPVDCSSSYYPEESICVDLILKHLQEALPALNVLLIDACRTLPSVMRDPASIVFKPGSTFEGRMKNNTIFGYSTPFLYSSHESDSECNSFFVKYLEKYISHDKSIQEILRQVQRDFEADPIIKGVQFPVINTSLSGDRKLCDKIYENKQIPVVATKDEYIKECDPAIYELPPIRSTIILETAPHLDIFINEIDITVYIFIEANAPIPILQDLSINLVSNLPDVKIIPCSECHLKTLSLKLGIKCELFKKRVVGIQRIKEKNFSGKLILQFSKLNIKQERTFSVNVEKISNLKLSVNNLGSFNEVRR